MTASSILSGSFPALGTVAGHPVTLHYGNIAAEYNALRIGGDARGPQCARAHAARGTQGRRAGDGAGHERCGRRCCPARACTPPRSRPRARSSPTCASSRARARLVVDAPPRAYAGWQAMVKKFINPQLAPSKDETGCAARDRRVRCDLAAHRRRRWCRCPSDALAALAAVRAHVRGRGRPDRDDHPLAGARARGLRVVRADATVLGRVAEAARARRDAGGTARVGDRAHRGGPPRVGRRHGRERRSRRKRTSTRCTRSRTRRVVTWDRRSWRACISAAT